MISIQIRAIVEKLLNRVRLKNDLKNIDSIDIFWAASTMQNLLLDRISLIGLVFVDPPISDVKINILRRENLQCQMHILCEELRGKRGRRLQKAALFPGWFIVEALNRQLASAVRIKLAYTFARVSLLPWCRINQGARLYPPRPVRAVRHAP